MYIEGFSSIQIADAHNTTSNVVIAILRKNDIAIRDSNKLSDREHIEIISLYNKGKSVYELGIEYDVSRVTISNILNKNSTEVRGNKRKVMCINTGVVFNSVTDASRWALKASKISEVCKGKRNYAGKHPSTGEKLRWKYI